MMLIEDVPDHLAEAEFGDQPTGAAVVWAFTAIGAAVCIGIAVLVALSV